MIKQGLEIPLFFEGCTFAIDLIHNDILFSLEDIALFYFDSVNVQGLKRFITLNNIVPIWHTRRSKHLYGTDTVLTISYDLRRIQTKKALRLRKAILTRLENVKPEEYEQLNDKDDLSNRLERLEHMVNDMNNTLNKLLPSDEIDMTSPVDGKDLERLKKAAFTAFGNYD